MMIAISLLVIVLLGLTTKVEGDELQWDELKFTQEWGYSACLQFKDAPGHPSKTCRFEGQPSIWSVHGIWPTKTGTSGPNFCSKVTFDIEQLTSIMSDLKEFWYEIDESKDAHHFWEHEWVKHGSCAKELDTFSTELKYFKAALDLRSKLDLYTVLKSGGGIVPQNDKSYSLDEIHAAFKTGLATTAAVPVVQCLKTKNEANEIEYHILQVEICLDQNLQILDCTKKPKSESKSSRSTKEKYGDQAMPCPHDQPIFYNDYNPKSNKNKKNSDAKSYNWMKLNLVKNFPLSSKYWKKLMHFKKHQPMTNLVD